MNGRLDRIEAALLALAERVDALRDQPEAGDYHAGCVWWRTEPALAALREPEPATKSAAVSISLGDDPAPAALREPKPTPYGKSERAQLALRLWGMHIDHDVEKLAATLLDHGIGLKPAPSLPPLTDAVLEDAVAAASDAGHAVAVCLGREDVWSLRYVSVSAAIEVYRAACAKGVP